MNIKNNSTCNNCGKHGHIYHHCKLPITSYGVILFRHSNKGLQFLMIRRKDSFGYIDFIRGKYACHNVEQIQQTIDEMSMQEKERLLRLLDDSVSFETLWNLLWGENNGIQYRGEESSSLKKCEIVRSGILNNDNEKITLEDIIKKSKTNWLETEWEFPKGRRNFQEKDLECAIREFEEETGYSNSDIIIVDNLLPFEEIFIGSNHKSYKHKYYLGYMNNINDDVLNFQKTEVSKLEWKTIDECLKSIRPYNLEKKQLIININKVLQEYRLYS